LGKEGPVPVCRQSKERVSPHESEQQFDQPTEVASDEPVCTFEEEAALLQFEHGGSG
jgi:hypothetical protein